MVTRNSLMDRWWFRIQPIGISAHLTEIIIIVCLSKTTIQWTDFLIGSVGILQDSMFVNALSMGDVNNSLMIKIRDKINLLT